MWQGLFFRAPLPASPVLGTQLVGGKSVSSVTNQWLDQSQASVLQWTGLNLKEGRDWAVLFCTSVSLSSFSWIREIISCVSEHLWNMRVTVLFCSLSEKQKTNKNLLFKDLTTYVIQDDLELRLPRVSIVSMYFYTYLNMHMCVCVCGMYNPNSFTIIIIARPLKDFKNVCWVFPHLGSKDIIVNGFVCFFRYNIENT